MIEFFPLVLSFIAGLMLALFYFGGLWLTVQRMTSVHRPVVWSLASFFARAALTLLGFYLVTQGVWTRLALSLLGFLLMRTILIYYWRPQSSV